MLNKEAACLDDITFQNDNILIELSVSLEHFHLSDCSEIIRRHSNRLFMIREGEHPLSGAFEEESIKTESNRAVQMISGIQYIKEDVANSKKFRKYESLKSPATKGEQEFKSMKTTEFVLKEIMERKEQDISLDDEQNDGMKSPTEANSNIQEKEDTVPKKSPLQKYQNLVQTPVLTKDLKDEEQFDEKFESLNSPNKSEILNIEASKPQEDEFDDFESIKKDSPSKLSTPKAQ